MAYIVAESEDKQSCKKLLETGIDLIERNFDNDISGQVSTLLSNGGTAILGAIDVFNDERQASGKEKIRTRRCFAHNIRMPNKRGGGKRGGKGSLPRYLLDNGCSAEKMAKIMAKIILFNYLPDAETFKVATNLLREGKKELHVLISVPPNFSFIALNVEYKDVFNDRVLKNYLDPEDPTKIGGRAANEFQGQNGSTQGVERRGGNVKDKLSKSVQGMELLDKANPINVLYAVAQDLAFKFSLGVQNFATKPKEKDSDNIIIRKLVTWK